MPAAATVVVGAAAIAAVEGPGEAAVAGFVEVVLLELAAPFQVAEAPITKKGL